MNDEQLSQETFEFNRTEEEDSLTNAQDDNKRQSDDFSEPDDFQMALDQLKNVARSLETGELPLEEAMERYREGLSLIDYCEERLDEAELLVEEIDDPEDGSPDIQSKENEE